VPATNATTRRKTPTSAEVARRAGVSRATVSYVLNDNPRQSISPETQQRVREAAAALGYFPNMAARSLRLGRSSTALLPMHGVELTELWINIAQAAARGLARRGITLVADFTAYESPEAQVEAGFRLGPAVVIDPLGPDRRRIEAFAAQGAAVLTSPAANPLGDVGVRQRSAQLEHLLAVGCRRIAFAGAPIAAPGEEEAALHAALRSVAEAAGATVELVVVERSAASFQAFVDKRLLGARPRLDGVAAFDDRDAVFLLTAAVAAGARVPGDVAIIGSDDAAISRATTPTLSTIRWELEAFGERIAEQVEELLADRPAHLPIETVEATVVARESTATTYR